MTSRGKTSLASWRNVENEHETTCTRRRALVPESSGSHCARERTPPPFVPSLSLVFLGAQAPLLSPCRGNRALHRSEWRHLVSCPTFTNLADQRPTARAVRSLGAFSPALFLSILVILFVERREMSNFTWLKSRSCCSLFFFFWLFWQVDVIKDERKVEEIVLNIVKWKKNYFVLISFFIKKLYSVRSMNL